MFYIDENDQVYLSVGDTAAFTITATGHTFEQEDRALFTVKDASGEVVLERIYELDGGIFTVQLANADTDYLAPGRYTWDVRYVLTPYYDDKGRIISGDQVITPKLALALNLLPTVGEV